MVGLLFFADFDDIAESLISKNASINAVDEKGWTELHHAAKNGLLNTIKLLLSKKKEMDKNGAIAKEVRLNYFQMLYST